MKSTNPFEETCVRTLHIKMFDKVWKWAGTYRKHELNIGCDAREITQRIPQLLGNTQYWLQHKTFPVDECLIRFHHQLVSKIHPFANGNGRHARMIADVVAVKYGRPEFTWGAGENLVAEGNARTAYLAALRALDMNENDVKPLLEFARS
jgi:Fic-DOC domain mobile mystery protein B